MNANDPNVPRTLRTRLIDACAVQACLAGVLTLVGRHAISGPCPLFAVSGNTRGSGKSRLVDCAVKLAHGTKAARSTLSGTDEETLAAVARRIATT